MKKATSNNHTIRQRILREARKLFLSKDFSQVSINEVMAAAGRTRGVFYTYFDSKLHLYREAIAETPDEDTRSSQPWYTSLLNNVVDKSKLDDIVPLKIFAQDQTFNANEFKQVYTQALKSNLKGLMHFLNADVERGESELLSTIAMVVGAETLCKNLNDDYLSEKIKSACVNSMIKAVNA